MTGSWHVYRQGERWRRPQSQARLVLTCGDRVAVCFNAPVVELLAPRMEAVHPVLSGLGPDILVDPFDIEEVRRRARARPPDTPVADLLLDQRVVAGIGNIYRCEALFREGRNPGAPQSSLSNEELDRLVLAARRLTRAQLGPRRPPERAVYGRPGRPCRRCGTPVEARRRRRRQGQHARTAYWCPRCEP
jgi:endonuclease-8